MIVSAAVKIVDKRQNKEIIIPCHRHCDAFYILKEFGYNRDEFKDIGQGFLDEHDNFYSRVEAMKIAIENNQLIRPGEIGDLLFSEDLW